jgi:PAS domain S-box-containing protein
MRDQDKSKGQLLDELTALRQQITDLESEEMERQRAARALRESEAKYRLLVEQSLQGILIVHASPLRVSFANQACSGIFGLVPEKLTSLSPKEIQEMIHPEDRPILLQRLGNLLDGAPPYGGRTVRFIRQDGTVRWTELHGRRIEFEGEPAVQVTVVDITERRAAEKELGRLRDLHGEIVRSMAEGIVMQDEDGNFSFVNPAAAALLGYTAEELAGQHWTAIIPPDQRPVVEAADKRRLRGATDRYELELLRADGQRIPVLVSGSPRFDGDRFVGSLAVFTDMSEQARARRLLQAMNHAALAMAEALTPDGIFTVVARELEAIGFSVAVLLPNEEQTELFPRHLSYAPRALAVAERLIGFKVKDLGIPIKSVSTYDTVYWGRQAVFTDNVTEIIHDMIPPPIRKAVGQIVKTLAVSRSIDAPLAVGDTRLGLLSVQSPNLTQADTPAITAFAHQMAAAWHRAQLLEQAQQEIAERKRIEAALRESEGRYRTLFEDSPISLWEQDFSAAKQRVDALRQQGVSDFRAYFEAHPELVTEIMALVKVTAVNKASLKLYGAKEQAELVAGLGQLVPEGTYDFEGLVRLAEGRTEHEWEGVNYTLSGERIDIKGHSSVVTGYEQSRAKVIVSIEDITARKRAEEEREQLLAQIQEQAQRVQQILATVPEGVLLLDPDGRVMMTNPQGSEDLASIGDARLGERLTTLGDRSLTELLSAPPAGLWHEVSAQERSFQVIARPVSEAGQTDPVPGGWVLVIRDVTQQREVEEQVQQQERLAAVGQLAAGIAHDFNNIMATIVLYAQMTARDQTLSERVRERMNTVNAQAHHASKLIQQILDFSRRAVLERRPLDLVPLLKEQVKLLERTLPENIEITSTIGPGDCTVTADPTRIQQALTNLALNARDAMPEGGGLHFEMARTRIEEGQAPLPEMEPGDWVQVTVSDTGTGIDPDVLPHIFEPFYTTKEVGQGSGLGLAQVHGIVGAHEGRINVETQVGFGTTFTIYLPALPAAPATRPTLGGTDLPAGKGETILVVEDGPSTRKAMVDSLGLLGYRALEAANGQEALGVIEEHGEEIIVILSNVVMPRMGGIALMDKLKEMGLDVGLVLVTGHPLEHQMEDLRAQGVIDWLPKPPSLEQLANVIDRALGNAKRQAATR